jgi:hypothetical protein
MRKSAPEISKMPKSTKTSPINLEELLAAPFPAEAIEWRVGSTTQDKKRGMALAYIDARDVQDRLDKVCGVFWQVRHHHCGADKLACEIGIKVGEEWLWRGDGAGSTDVEAEKGAFSDSFKRAAVRWGIGRYLYELASPWVELEVRGRTHVIKANEMAKLRRLLGGASQMPAEAPAEPSGQLLHLTAHEEASKGANALRAFWGALENREKIAICRALKADPAKGCPQSLKLTAEQADQNTEVTPTSVPSPAEPGPPDPRGRGGEEYLERLIGESGVQ